MSVIAKCGFKEKIALTDIEQLKKINFKGLMRLNSAKRKKAVYTAIKATPLRERLEKPITKYEFFFILEQFLIIMEECEKNNFSVKGISFSLNNAYITESTKEIQMLYCPLEKSTIQVVPMDFIESLVYTAIPAQESDMEYVTRLAYFLKTLTAFNINKIETYISNEEPRVLTILGRNKSEKKEIPVERETVESHSTDGNKNRDLLKARIVNRNPLDDDSTLLAEDDDATILGEDDDRTLLNTETDGEETEFLDTNPSNNTKMPYLIRIATSETVKITKTSFRIGIKAESVDYVVTNNNAVSRSHADIISRNGRFFVYDLESKNKTYVNDRVLPSKTEVEIFNGDNIKFANEEFIFHS